MTKKARSLGLKHTRFTGPVGLSYGNVSTAVQAMEKGATVIEKPFDPDIVVDRVRRALAQDVRNRREQRQRADVEAHIAQLTPREREVMELVVAGKTTKEISRRLGASVRTIETHRGRLMRKMEIKSVAELASLAARFDLGSTPDRVEGDTTPDQGSR